MTVTRDPKTGVMKITINEEDGWFRAKIVGTDGVATDIKLDCVKCRNHLVKLTSDIPDVAERNVAWCAFLVGEGVPPVSHGAGFKLAEAILAEFEATHPPEARRFENPPAEPAGNPRFAAGQ